MSEKKYNVDDFLDKIDSKIKEIEKSHGVDAFCKGALAQIRLDIFTFKNNMPEIKHTFNPLTGSSKCA